MTKQTIIHLIDDTTPGGVMRVLDYISTHPDLTGTMHHVFRQINRGSELHPGCRLI